MDFPYIINMEATGNNIRRMRKERGIKVTEISKFLMIDKQAVYNWEHGQSLPQLENCLGLARLFHSTVEEIIIETGEANASPFCFLRNVYTVYTSLPSPCRISRPYFCCAAEVRPK